MDAPLMKKRNLTFESELDDDGGGGDDVESVFLARRT